MKSLYCCDTLVLGDIALISCRYSKASLTHFRTHFSQSQWALKLGDPVSSPSYVSSPLSISFKSRVCPQILPLFDQTPHSVQARGEDMDNSAAARDMPPLLCPCGDAHLCRQHGREVQLEQEGVRHGAGQLLLGLLLHPSARRLCQWSVGRAVRWWWILMSAQMWQITWHWLSVDTCLTSCSSSVICMRWANSSAVFAQPWQCSYMLLTLVSPQRYKQISCLCVWSVLFKSEFTPQLIKQKK